MNMKRIIALILTVGFVFSSVGCGSTTNTFKGNTDGSELTLWSEPSTMKILQDDQGEAVKTADKKSVLTVNMARNESEGVQLMMYAKKDIDSYQVSVSDLVSETGIIPAKDIDIYQLKYQQNNGGYTTGNPEFVNGYIPDPMLIFDKAVEYNETTIAKGNNQAIWLDVTTTKGTAAGIYYGLATVTTEKEEYSIPMEVNVYDVTLDDTPGLLTYFSTFNVDSYASAELDGSIEMQTTYFEEMLKYNMASALPFQGEGGIERYLELLRKYYDADGLSCYRLYYPQEEGTYDGTQIRYNLEVLKQYIKAIAEISVEDKVNYLDKAIFYGYTVNDEPAQDYQYEICENNITNYKKALADADEELRAEFAGTEGYEYYTKYVSPELLTIPNILPGGFHDIDRIIKYNMEDITFCPGIHTVHTEAHRNRLKALGDPNKQLWTYSCVGPRYPYVSGHIDDNSLGWRLASWMCFDYGFDGYLMYAVAQYIWIEGGEVIEDAWETMNTGQSSAGDGKLFYPGEKYGIDGPCPSIRAMIWRDGVDDYALLEELRDIYKEYGADCNVALKNIFETLYTGFMPSEDSYLFEELREQVFDMIVTLKTNVAILYTEQVQELGIGRFSFVCVNEKAVVTVDNKTLQPGDGGIYTVELDLTKQTSYTFTVTCGKDSKEYTCKFMNGIIRDINSFEESKDASTLFHSALTGYQASINTDADYVDDGKASVHVTVEDGKEVVPYFAISRESDLIGGSFADMKSLIFNVYNAAEVDTSVQVVYYINQEYIVGEYTLTAGEWTTLEIDLPTDIDLDDILEYDFSFSAGESIDLYIDSFVTVVEEE